MRGGSRKGAGRKPGTIKPDKKIQIGTRLSLDVVEWLRSQDRPIAQIIERLVRQEIERHITKKLIR